MIRNFLAGSSPRNPDQLGEVELRVQAALPVARGDLYQSVPLSSVRSLALVPDDLADDATVIAWCAARGWEHDDNGWLSRGTPPKAPTLRQVAKEIEGRARVAKGRIALAVENQWRVDVGLLRTIYAVPTDLVGDEEIAELLDECGFHNDGGGVWTK